MVGHLNLNYCKRTPYDNLFAIHRNGNILSLIMQSWLLNMLMMIRKCATDVDRLARKHRPDQHLSLLYREYVRLTCRHISSVRCLNLCENVFFGILLAMVTGSTFNILKPCFFCSSRYKRDEPDKIPGSSL